LASRRRPRLVARVAVCFRAHDFQIFNLSLGGRSIARDAGSRALARDAVARAVRGVVARASSRRRGRVRYGVRAAASDVGREAGSFKFLKVKCASD